MNRRGFLAGVAALAGWLGVGVPLPKVPAGGMEVIGTLTIPANSLPDGKYWISFKTEWASKGKWKITFHDLKSEE